MNREAISRYCLNLVKEILKEKPEMNTILLSSSGDDYEMKCYDLGISIYGELDEAFDISIAYGASKLVLIPSDSDYVIKIPFGIYNNVDFCKIEEENYLRIKEDEPELAKYFAECWRAGEVFVENEDNEDEEVKVPIYIMRRTIVDETKVSDASYNLYINSGGDEEDYCIDDENDETYSCFEFYYGIEELERILDIIDTLGINDLHTGNVGFINNMPVFIDYSGFH